MIYFDEAGYTGPDLTNSEQPFFTLASIRMSDDEIEKMKDEIKYSEWGKEFHFSGMYSNHLGRSFLQRVFDNPIMDSSHVKLAFASKRYCVYANIVNTLVETYYHNHGVNLYENARNLFLANLLYYYATWHSNEGLITEFETSFINMMRNQSVESIAVFYRTADKLRFDDETPKVYFELLSEIPPTIECVKEALSVQKFYLDLTIPLFSSLIQEWYKETRIKDDVKFDSSEPFYANKAFLESLRDMQVQETLVGYGKNKHTYPLPVGKLEIAQSQNEFGIQLADIYASALTFAITPRKDKYKKYQTDLQKLPLFQCIPVSLAPSSIDWIVERMKETSDLDPIEFICDHVR